MISGAHVILYSKDVDADRAFFRDVLKFPSVDAGRGWLIFALPPAELAMHPAEGNAPSHELYLMCPDLAVVLASLTAKHVRFEPPTEARWGTVVHLELPSGTRIGLYQPKHPTALTLWSR
jgi:catechol 2,3-dioxygenase-like lactoylglutathione lyase family enzyme